MTRDEMKTLMRRIKAQYGDRFITVTQDVFDVWCECLSDCDFEKAKQAVDNHAKTSDYAPTIADICRGVQEKIDTEQAIKNRVKEIYDAIHYPDKTEESERLFMETAMSLKPEWQVKGAEWIRHLLRAEMKTGRVRPICEVIKGATSRDGNHKRVSA